MSAMFTWQLPMDSTAAGQARWHLRDVSSSDLEAVDAELVVTELVNNAWKHGSGSGGITLSADVREDSLHIEVCGDASGEPQVLRSQDTAATGRGLLMIDELVNDWGFERRESVICVWADVPRR
jgi:two-component sensor histidine kinase